ncbi:MAG TPA: hypothetical protein EYP85_00715, partial [Armatimonadetes bacterium]|nr:hypothetical protein [Armatimonadota bacterium]
MNRCRSRRQVVAVGVMVCFLSVLVSLWSRAGLAAYGPNRVPWGGVPTRQNGTGTVEGYVYTLQQEGRGGGGPDLWPIIGGAALVGLLASLFKKKEPGPPAALGRAWEAFWEGRFDEAVNLAQEAQEKAKKDQHKQMAYAYLAYAYVGLGETERAKETFRELLRRWPKFQSGDLPQPVPPKVERVFREVQREERAKEWLAEGPLFPPPWVVWARSLRPTGLSLASLPFTVSKRGPKEGGPEVRIPSFQSRSQMVARSLGPSSPYPHARLLEPLIVSSDPTPPEGYQPLEGATVTLSNGTQRQETTDARGYFIFTEIPEGTYRLQVEGNGYALETLLGVTPGETVSLKYPTPRPTCQVLSPHSGAPIYLQPGQRVTIRWEYTETHPQRATLRIYKGETTIGEVTIEEGLRGGISLQRTDEVPLSETAPEGPYEVTVALMNQKGISASSDPVGELIIVDNTPPTVFQHIPPRDTQDVALNTVISVTFREAMDQTSVETAFAVEPSLPGTFSWRGNTLTFTPEGNLARGTTYRVTIRGTA